MRNKKRRREEGVVRLHSWQRDRTSSICYLFSPSHTLPLCLRIPRVITVSPS